MHTGKQVRLHWTPLLAKVPQSLLLSSCYRGPGSGPQEDKLQSGNFPLEHKAQASLITCP